MRLPTQNVRLSVRRHLWAFLGVVLLLCTIFAGLYSDTRTARAATNGTINFQARLMNGAGSIAPDGNYNVEFKLYTAAAIDGGETLVQGSCTTTGPVADEDCKWTETRVGGNKVSVANGYLTVNLGSVTSFPSTINWDQELWLGMNIGGTGSPAWDNEMSPRLKLTSVPYAFRAAKLASLAGSFTGVLQFAASFAQDSVITLPDPGGSTATVCYQSSASCGFATGTSSSYIQNTTTVQTGANFAIRSAATGSVGGVIQGANGQSADLFDIQTWNGTTATTVVGVSNVGLVTLGAGLTVTGTTQINTSGSANTSINTGSTGTIGIGNASAGALTVASGAASTVTIGNTLALSATNFSLSSAGVLTLAGGQTKDIATPNVSTSNGTATSLAIKAGDETSSTCGTSCTAGSVTIQGGAASGAGGTRLGGSVTIDGGAGSTPGSVNIGTGTAVAINVGSNAAAHTILIGNSASGDNDVSIGSANSGSTLTLEAGTASGSIAIGNGTTAHNIQIGTGAGVQTVSLGSTNTTSALTLQAGSVGTSLVTGASNAATTGTISLATGAQTGSSLSSGAITLTTGDAAGGTNASSGNLSLNTGTKSGSGSVGTINIGVTNGSPITTGAGLFTQGGNITFSGTAARTITGPATGGLTVNTTGGDLALSTTTSGTLAVTSAGALNLTGAAASTLSAGSNTLQVTSSNFSVSTLGAITAATSTNTINNLVINNGSLTNVGANITGAGAVILASGGSGALTIDSASGTAILGSTTTVLQKAGTAFSFELNNASNSTLTVTNTNTGVASLSVEGSVTATSANLTNNTNQLVLGTTNTTTITMAGILSSQTLTIPNLSGGNGTICTSAVICAAPTTQGNYLVQNPTANATNTVTPTGATTGLTVNGSSTATLAVAINQGQAADAVNVAVSSSGTTTNGLLVSRAVAGTTTNGLNVTNATGTTTNGLAITNSSGTITSGITLTQSGGTFSTGVTFAGTMATGISFGGTNTTDITRTSGVLSLQGTGGVSITAAGTTTISADTAGAGTVSLGAANATTVTVGSVGITSKATNINIGTTTANATQNISIGANAAGGGNSANNTVVIDAGSTATGIQIGNSAQAHGIQIGTGGGIQTVVLGSTSSTSTTSVQGGTGSTAVSIQAASSGTIVIGNTNSNAITLGGTSGTTTLNGTIKLNTVGAVTSNSVALCRDTSTTNLTACDSGAGGVPFIQGGNSFGAAGVLGTNDSNNLQFETNNVVRATFDTSNALYLGNGVTAASPNNFTISGTGSSAATVAGANMTLLAGTGNTTGIGGQTTVQGGTGGNGAATAGGAVLVQGGTAAGSGASNGGGVTIQGGTAAGSGVKGLIQLNGATFFTTGTYSSGSTSSFTQSLIDSNSAIIATATTGSLTFTVPSPTNGASQAGRLLYISNASSGSNAFTLAGAGASFTLNTSSTATLLWNGTAWTSAGVDAGTLQNDYTNSVGGTTAEMILDSTRRGIDIQDASGGTIGATEAMLSIRGVATASTLGASLFAVNAGGKVGINVGGTTSTPTITYDLSFGNGAGRTIGIEPQTVNNTAGGALTVRAGNGLGTGVGALLTLTGGSASTGNAAGGGVTIQGGAAASTTTGGIGGNITIQGGNGSGSGASHGGAITLFGGTGAGTGVAGNINLATSGGTTTVGRVNIGFATQGTAASAYGGSDSNAGTSLAIKDVLEVVNSNPGTTISQILFTNTSGSGDFRMGSGGGDLYWQGGGGRALQVGAYWPTIITGDRGTSTLPAFINGATGTSVFIESSVTGDIALQVRGVSASQTGNLLNVQKNSGAAQVMTIGANGAALFKSNAASATAFVVQDDSTTNNLLEIDNSANIIDIGISGSTAAASTVNIANTTGNATQTVNIGATNSASNAVLVQGGTGANAIRLLAGAVGTITVGDNSVAQTVNLGSSNGASATLVRAGSGGLSLTSGANITLGASDTTGTLLVLDTDTDATEATGVNGAIYYNSGGAGASAPGKFRCFEGGVWKNCIGAANIVDRRWGYIVPVLSTGATAYSYNGSVVNGQVVSGTGVHAPQTNGNAFSYTTGTTAGNNNGFGATGPIYQPTVTQGQWLPKITARIQAGTSSSVRYWVGLSDTTLTGTNPVTTSTGAGGLDYIGMGSSTAISPSGVWICGAGNGTNHNGVSTGVTIVAGHTYDLVIDMSSGTLICSVSDDGGAFVTVTGPNTTPTTAPSNSVNLGITMAATNLTTGGGNADIIYIYYFYIDSL